MLLVALFLLMDSKLSYTFTSDTNVTGSNSRFYIPPSAVGFNSLDITQISIDDVSIPTTYFNIETRDAYLCNVGGRDIRITLSSSTVTPQELIDSLNERLTTYELGTATLSSITAADGTTAYRLTITSDQSISVAHHKHKLALAVGLEEMGVGSGPYTFKMPIEQTIKLFNKFNTNSEFTIYGVISNESAASCTFYIPNGQYTESQLASTLNTLISASTSTSPDGLNTLSNPFVGSGVTYDDKARRLQFTLRCNVNVIDYTFNTNPLVGFKMTQRYSTLNPSPVAPETPTITSGTDVIFYAPSPPMLRRTNIIAIQSVQLGSIGSKKRIWPTTNIIASIPVTEPYGTVQTMKTATIIRFNNSIRLNYIDLAILCDDGSTLDLNGYPWSITMTFNFTNRPPL